jgi:hypothetical protein
MGRDENGVLIPDNVTFPDGIASLADYGNNVTTIFKKLLSFKQCSIFDLCQ